MKCINECGKDTIGRSKYCSDSCKVLYNRKQSVTVNRKKATVNSDTKVYVKSAIDLSPDTNPNTNQPVTLSDGQQFYLDPRPAQHIAEHRQGAGTPYQQQLATLSLQYDILKGSDKARARAKQVLDKEGGAWC